MAHGEIHGPFSLAGAAVVVENQAGFASFTAERVRVQVPSGRRRHRRPSRRGVSRNGVLAEKFHILTSTGALNLQLFDCKYEDVRKAAVLQMLEAIFAKH